VNPVHKQRAAWLLPRRVQFGCGGVAAPGSGNDPMTIGCCGWCKSCQTQSNGVGWGIRPTANVWPTIRATL
jgi:hypothetical protein